MPLATLTMEGRTAWYLPGVCSPTNAQQAPVIHLGRVLSVGDGIARVYGLKSVQVRLVSRFLAAAA
jgi:hypothetical protein